MDLANNYGCTYIDIHFAFAVDSGEIKAELTREGVQLSEVGYVKYGWTR